MDDSLEMGTPPPLLPNMFGVFFPEIIKNPVYKMYN